MAKKMAKKENKMDIPPEKCFWVNKGPILRNLKELLTALKKMKNETFMHHVNEKKNDFSKWVEEVFGNKKLAEELRKIKTKQEAIRVIKKAI